MTSSSALNVPRSTAVFNPFAMCLFYLLEFSGAEAPQQLRQKRGAPG